MINHKKVIQNGSKSFSLASLFFSEEKRIAAWKLYSWCRYSDDLVDNETDMKKVNENILFLNNQINNLTNVNYTLNEEFTDLREISLKYKIPSKYPADLIRGMQMDVEGKVIKSHADLIDYCYCVAGTVGLMMCHVMGIKNDKALEHAVSLGIGMQLTNIARDISEDLTRNRLYIPEDWIKEQGHSREVLMIAPDSSNFLALQSRLLNLADEYYTHGNHGLKYLSYQSALTILIASQIYKEIGAVIRKDPAHYLIYRAVVSKPKKMYIVIKSIFMSIPMLFSSSSKKAVYIPNKMWGLVNEN